MKSRFDYLLHPWLVGSGSGETVVGNVNSAKCSVEDIVMDVMDCQWSPPRFLFVGLCDLTAEEINSLFSPL